MFLSKNLFRVSNIVGRTQNDISVFKPNISRLLTTQVSTETAIPDKLYKRIEIEVRGHDPAVLKSYGQFSVMTAENLGITVTRNISPRKAIHERLTLLKSVHIYKKHRVQYETRTYYRFLDFVKLTGSTADTFLEYLQRNLPEGVAMKVTKVEIQKLPESINTTML